jgi:O-antigen/teichoic acid export membrane protein
MRRDGEPPGSAAGVLAVRRRSDTPRDLAADETQRVGTRTLHGIFWAYGSYVVGRFLVLLSVAILAHLLSPSQFGLVAFALTVTALLDTISDIGVGQALVVAEEDEQFREKATTAWKLSVLLGLGLTILTIAASPLAARFFKTPELTPLLAVLGLNFLVRGVGATHFAIAQKQIDFRTRTAAELADVVVRGLTGVALALAGAGAWSLVLGYLAGSAAMTATLWSLVAFRPRLRGGLPHLGGLVRFGGGLTTLAVLGAVTANVDYIFVGRVLGAADLGLYTLGFRLPELLIMNLSLVAGLVLFPAFAALRPESMTDAFLTSLRYTLMVTVPLTIGLSVLARPLTLTLFGEHWRDSVPVMQVLAVFAFAVTVGIPAGTVYKSLGRLRVLIALGLPRTGLAVASIWAFVDKGIVAVAACQAAVAGLFAAIGIALAARLLSTGPGRIARAAWPSLAGGVVMAGVLAVPVWTIDSPGLVLLVGAPLGAFAYLGTLWILAPDSLHYLWATAFPGRAQTVASTPGDPAVPPERVGRYR